MALVVFLSVNMAFISFVVTLLTTMKESGGALSLHDSTFNDFMGSLIFLGSVIFLICSGLGFFITIFLSHRFVGPIERIKNVVDGLTAGLPQDDIQLRTNDELNDLAQAVNRLSKKLR